MVVGDASGNLDLSGNLSVGGDADISGNLDVSGNLSVVGDASFCNVLVNCDLDVSGNTDMSGNLTVDGNLVIVGDVSFNNNVIINNDLDVSGNLNVSVIFRYLVMLILVNVLVRCDLDVSGNTDMSGNLTVVKDATFNDNINVTNDAIVRNTNLIQTFEGMFDQVLWVLPPIIVFQSFSFSICSKTTAISSGYFTIQVSTPDYLQTINFIAGIIENKTPFIKILSNINQNFLEGIEDISIGQDTITIGGDPNYYLTFRFKVQQGNSRPVDYMKITLVNNHNNYDANPFQGMNWKLLDQPNETPAGFTYTYLASAELDLNGGNAYGLSTQREYFQNDIVMGPSGNIVANDGTGTIDICGNLYVNRDATFTNVQFI